MWADFTDRARAELRRSHTAASRVDILRAGRPVHRLVVTGGKVSTSASRPVRANLQQCIAVDPTGALSKGDVEALLNAYQCEIAVHRGVTYGPRSARVTELAPLGVFGLTSSTVDDTPDGLRIELNGQDRAMNYQVEMNSALNILGGTPIEEAILRLLLQCNAGVTLRTMRTGFTCGPLLYKPEINVWREAQNLAASVGARLFHDRTGQAVLTPMGPASDRPVTAYTEGEGLLLTAKRQEDADTIRNVVIAESTNGAIRVVVADDDPTSPTYANGRYGRRPVVLPSQHYGSVDQARQAARARLAYELGRTETVTFTAVPDPALDVEEALTVHRPASGLEHRGVVTDVVEMPLSATEPMQITCRRSRLTPDGQVLPVSELAA